ncbi:hypothetical protein CYY_006323 [Polysphondylium violaceum]|uniref:Cytochrome P450 family protein n=1 Tax=Polysphondylium violaceum TaxID=133409 RepID=A0A8J4PRJ2_9MYCE|nr:hypothetical protein CYY_006323 [Polysphondylium violaceum]
MLTTILLLLIFYIIIDLIIKNRYPASSPPGPSFTLPIIGDLGKLRDLSPAQFFYQQSKIYGNIFRTWLGDQYTVVVSDPKLVREIFVKNFDNFVNRSDLLSLRLISNDYKTLSSGRDMVWKRNKEMIVQALTLKLRTHSSVIQENCEDLIKIMKDYQQTNQPFSPKLFLSNYTLNIILQFVFSFKLRFDDEIQGKIITQEVYELFDFVGHFGFGQFIKSIGYPYYFYKRYMDKSVLKNLKLLINQIVQDHLKKLDPENPKDILDAILLKTDQNDADDRQLPYLLAVDLLLAGVLTSADTIQFFLIAMANNPDIQEKAYQELNQVVEKGTQATIYHRPSTSYFNAIIKEVMRWRPIVPLGLPRAAKDDIYISEYFIPKDTQILINMDAIFTSEENWENPKDFIPERFINNTHSDLFIPFGVGPRSCIGVSLAMDEVYTACTNILLNFKVSSVDGNKIDDSSIADVTLHPKYDFSIKLTNRDN